jgi:hypothetical protein
MTPGVSRLINVRVGSIGANRKLMRAEQWLEKFQSHVHKRVPDASWDVTVGSGSQDLMYKVRY